MQPSRDQILDAVYSADPDGVVNTTLARAITDRVVALLQPHELEIRKGAFDAAADVVHTLAAHPVGVIESMLRRLASPEVTR